MENQEKGLITNSLVDIQKDATELDYNLIIQNLGKGF